MSLRILKSVEMCLKGLLRVDKFELNIIKKQETDLGVIGFLFLLPSASFAFLQVKIETISYTRQTLKRQKFTFLQVKIETHQKKIVEHQKKHLHSYKLRLKPVYL